MTAAAVCAACVLQLLSFAATSDIAADSFNIILCRIYRWVRRQISGCVVDLGDKKRPRLTAAIRALVMSSLGGLSGIPGVGWRV